MKTKTKIVVAVATIVAAVVAFKRVLTGETGLQELAKQEEKVKQEAEAKLAEEKAKLEAEKQEQLAKIAAEEQDAKKKLEEAEVNQKASLKELSKTDKEAFKKEVEKKLGVSSSKKGRKKK